MMGKVLSRCEDSLGCIPSPRLVFCLCFSQVLEFSTPIPFPSILTPAFLKIIFLKKCYRHTKLIGVINLFPLLLSS